MPLLVLNPSLCYFLAFHLVLRHCFKAMPLVGNFTLTRPYYYYMQFNKSKEHFETYVQSYLSLISK